jgi:xanthine dehydrogenase molybdopterin-binding subunit B
MIPSEQAHTDWLRSHAMGEFTLQINGQRHTVSAPQDESLLSVLRNQQMGATVQAIGGALFERILFGDGRIQNPHFSSYRVPRFSDTPEIEIVLLDRKDLPPAANVPGIPDSPFNA